MALLVGRRPQLTYRSGCLARVRFCHEHGKWAGLERESGKVLLENVSKDEATAFAEARDKAA